jgi:hypothetical protein
MELAFAHLDTEKAGSKKVVEAESRFVARGGQWNPSQEVARAIDQVALGALKCRRL